MYLAEISSHLHGDDTKMIFFIDPDEEGFGIVVEDTTPGRPEATSVRSLEETIAFLKEEMIVNQFLLNLFAHARQWVEGTLEFVFKSRESAGYFLLHFLILGLS